MSLPFPAPTKKDTAAELADKVFATSCAMQALVNQTSVQDHKNKYTPQVTYNDPNGCLLKERGVVDGSIKLLTRPAANSVEDKTFFLTQLTTLMSETTDNFKKGVKLETVEDNWKIKLVQLSGTVDKEYNAAIANEPAADVKANLAKERDAVIAQLGNMQKTDASSPFHAELQRVNDSMQRQYDENRSHALMFASRAKGLKFVPFVDLEAGAQDKNLKEIEAELEKNKATGVKTGMDDPIDKTGIYKLRANQHDKNASGVYFNKETNTAYPFPAPQNMEEWGMQSGPDFKQAWSETFNMLAERGISIKIDGTNEKNLAAMIDIMADEHKDHYMILSDQALQAISMHPNAMAIMAKYDKHNQDLKDIRTRSTEQVLTAIKAAEADKRQDLEGLTKSVHQEQMARINTLLTEIDPPGVPHTPERQLELVERLVIVIQQQVKELEHKSDQQLVDPDIQDRMSKIEEARAKIEAIVQPQKESIATLSKPLSPENVARDAKLSAVLTKCQDVEKEVEKVQERKSEAEAASRPAKP